MIERLAGCENCSLQPASLWLKAQGKENVSTMTCAMRLSFSLTSDTLANMIEN